MNSHGNDIPIRRSGVRVVDLSAESAAGGGAIVAEEERRRIFLRRALACGAAVPALVGLSHLAAGESKAATNSVHVVRNFTDPYLELVRLLREACEVEHALMLQYLYGALSLKPAYQALAGSGVPGSDTLLGVAIQEMQHLAAVNRLLVALGASPNLVPAEFPYEPQIYPFEFNLEPLSPRSLAKYIYAEAPVGFFDARQRRADENFAATVLAMIGPKRRPNHVGSLYIAIIELTREVGQRPGFPNHKAWLAKLEAIKTEGEVNHFGFFKSVLLATHPAFQNHRNAWRISPTHATYPAYSVPVNPTAYIGHENQILNPDLLALAWLSNLHYWTVLLLLDQHFRTVDPAPRGLALAHMMGPLLSLGRHLPALGCGLPFDPLNFGSAPALDGSASRRLIASLVRESITLAKGIALTLPADYPQAVAESTLASLTADLTASGHSP